MENTGEPDLSLKEKGDDCSNQKIKYPKSVFFIISNEFCERFSFYGMQTILSLYLVQALRYSETSATLIYHCFVMLCYFSPFLGGIMADSWLGKYKTILYVSLLYAFGNIVLSVSSVSVFSIPHAAFSLLGLLLIGLGTGGIKPCVTAFGGDQFVLPQQEMQLQRFFSIFYFSINAGGLVSTFFTPILREQVQCFGQDNCYPLAFGIPAILMCISVVFFVCGKPMYKIKKPGGNIALDVVKCIGHALLRKIQTQKMEKKNHWLDYAAPKYSHQLIEDTKIFIKITILFTPTIFFWALFEQQGSKWIFQATNMDGNINGWFTIQPDQMLTINPVLSLVLIPIFESYIYPLLNRLRIIRTPLQKLTWGGFFAAASFLISGLIQLRIENDKAVIPAMGEAQLRLYNTFNCPIHVESPEMHINSTLPALDTIEFLHLPVNGKKDLKIKTYLDKFCADNSSLQILNANVEIRSQEISSYLFTSPLSIQTLSLNGSEEVQKSIQGTPKLKVIFGGNTSLDIQLKGPSNAAFQVKNYQSAVINVKERGIYSVIVKGKALKPNMKLLPGGFYTFMILGNGENMYGKMFTITKPNSVNMLWQIPQIFAMTIAEIMFSITGLEFSFTQSPESMKSVVTSLWHLTDSLGNIIVLIIESTQIFQNKAYEFFLFAGMMTVIMLIFIRIAVKYKYTSINNT